MAKHYSARELLEKLVSFPTVSSESNLELVDWVEGYLASHGVKSHRVYNAQRTKANLYANIGPEVEGGVILSGHTDVVPVKGQDWDTDPFTVVEKDGKLYGRGTCDMKGFDALALAAVPLALERGLKRPIQIALSYDEEVGCVGAPDMIEAMATHMPRAAAAIIGEPSMMKTVSGHKGAFGVRTHVHGFEVHSSLLHIGVSAVMEAAKLVDWCNQ
ncbi:MAG: M20/M25/M40 family metallo-hydrolase, partial [Marinosulfonomonas sp.]|nr:M20/M25/M40 family metallo-hydrolase [Marinosulfonomonas sp.]